MRLRFKPTLNTLQCGSSLTSKIHCHIVIVGDSTIDDRINYQVPVDQFQHGPLPYLSIQQCLALGGSSNSKILLTECISHICSSIFWGASLMAQQSKFYHTNHN